MDEDEEEEDEAAEEEEAEEEEEEEEGLMALGEIAVEEEGDVDGVALAPVFTLSPALARSFFFFGLGLDACVEGWEEGATIDANTEETVFQIPLLSSSVSTSSSSLSSCSSESPPVITLIGTVH